MDDCLHIAVRYAESFSGLKGVVKVMYPKDEIGRWQALIDGSRLQQ